MFGCMFCIDFSNIFRCYTFCLQVILHIFVPVLRVCKVFSCIRAERGSTTLHLHRESHWLIEFRLTMASAVTPHYFRVHNWLECGSSPYLHTHNFKSITLFFVWHCLWYHSCKIRTLLIISHNILYHTIPLSLKTLPCRYILQLQKSNPSTTYASWQSEYRGF